MSAPQLIQLHGTSWVIPGPTNIGLFETQSGVYLIDSGNDKESGRKITKILAEKNWTLQGILNTHSNADHVGANDYLQRMTKCRIFATRAEKAFIESPQIEAGFLWGGFPPMDMKNKFFEAKPSDVTDIIEAGTQSIPDLRLINLPGHYYQMVGFVTPDRVVYLGDCMFGERVLLKYKIPYIYDVGEYKRTIERIKDLDVDYYVLSHGDIEKSIDTTADLNIEVVNRIESYIVDLAGAGKTFEEILQAVCTKMDIRLDIGQYALIGNTVRSFLSYLYNNEKLQITFSDNKLYWKAI